MNPITVLASRAAETAAGAPPITSLPTAAWDIVSFLGNALVYIKTAGGGLLMLMGIAALVWGGVLLTKKLMSGQQNQDSWVKIICLVIIGGAIGVGGFNLVFMLGSGGKTTIEDLGGATFLWDSIPVFGSLLGLG
jgi:membrane-bound ClpP family serine protease